MDRRGHACPRGGHPREPPRGGSTAGRTSAFGTTVLLAVAAAQALPTARAAAQELDYHLEETPAVSWNDAGFHDARMLAVGRVSLMASSAFAGASNPASMSLDGSRGMAVSATRAGFEAAQYWGINQGSVSTGPELPSAEATFLDGLAVYWSRPGWALSAGWYVSALLRSPGFEQRQDYEAGQYSERSWTFDGSENVLFVAAALPAWRGLRAGLRLDYMAGTREVGLRSADAWYFLVPTGWELRRIERVEEQENETRVIAPSVGLSWRATPSWTVAGRLTWPLPGSADRRLTRSFENRADQVVISDSQTSSDRHRRPRQAALGTAFDFDLRRLGWSRPLRLRLAAEAEHVAWSGYRYELFGQELRRDLRDTLALAGGMELSYEARAGVALRLGYRRDPQPVTAASATVEAFSGGAGVRFQRLALDAGAAWYRGSAGGTEQHHSALTVTVSYAAR